MDFFDNAVDKAKEVFSVAYSKTNEVVTTQKQKFDIACEEKKRSKDFEKIGEIYYEMIKNSEIEDQTLSELVASVNDRNAKIEALKKELNNIKNKRVCPNCSANIEENSIYCNVCGTKLEFGSDEND